MKKNTKIITKKKIILSICLLVLIAFAVLLINFYPLLLMNTVETGEIAGTGIIAINNGMVNVFLAESSEGYILFDCGTDMAKLEKSLDEMGIEPSEVKFIFLTHSDADHVTGAPLFPDAVILMGEDELQMIDGTTERAFGSGNRIPGRTDRSRFVLLEDEQAFTIGGSEIRCIKAPGHTPGSMFYILDGDFLFTGDAIMISGKKAGVHPFTMDEETSNITIESFYEIMRDTELILTSHYGCHSPLELI